MQTLTKQSLAVLSISISFLTGCAGTSSNLNLPSISTLQNPVRVPPPARGSFRVPAQYTGASNSAQASNPNIGSTNLANNFNQLPVTNQSGNVLSTSDSDWHASRQPPIQIATNNQPSSNPNTATTASFVDSTPIGTGVLNTSSPSVQRSASQPGFVPPSTATLNSSALSRQGQPTINSDPPSLDSTSAGSTSAGSTTRSPNFRPTATSTTPTPPPSNGLNLNPLVPNDLSPRQ